MYQIGRVANTHGLNGDVLVREETDFTELFQEGQTVYTEINGNTIELIIEKIQIHKASYLIHFKGYDSIDDAEHLKGLTLQVKQDQLPELEEGQFHYHEIVDCDVYTVDGEKIGHITSILAPGANDVWVVENEQGKEFLIPAINDVIEEINVQEKKIVIFPMEGLLD